MHASPESKLYIGTSGWSYPDWEGTVYPRGKRIDQLRFIAQYFNAVELNNTFYRPPTAKMTESWVKRTSDAEDFHFTLKLWQRFTHERHRPYDTSDVDLFKRGIEPLAASGRLGGMLIQFPWSFANSDEAREHIARLCRDFSDTRKWIEVRHRSWDVPESYAFFRELKLGVANIDQPISKTSIRPGAILTSESAYVRLHGRNARAWFDQGAGRNEKYNYLYSDDELREWVDHIEKLRKDAVSVYAFLNNHYRGQAPANALQLASTLMGRKVDVPETLLATFPRLEQIATGGGSDTGRLF